MIASKKVHGWDYRRIILPKVNSRTDKDEWAYSKDKIYQNFSNFSAWHYRSKLLDRVFTDEKEKLDVISAGIAISGARNPSLTSQE